MISDKTKPQEIEIEDSIEVKMIRLEAMKREYKANRKAFQKENEHLLASIKSTENLVSSEILEKGHTVRVGNIIAEYIPQVRIRIKPMREENDGE